MRLKILFCIVLVLSLVGCATTRKEVVDIKTQQLETRIRQLEKDVQQKDKKIYELENKLELVRSESNEVGQAVFVVKERGDVSKATSKKIQIALKKAGFYNGSIDGKIGNKTKKSIKEFQKANGLSADGIVGKKTWAALQKYLD